MIPHIIDTCKKIYKYMQKNIGDKEEYIMQFYNYQFIYEKINNFGRYTQKFLLKGEYKNDKYVLISYYDYLNRWDNYFNDSPYGLVYSFLQKWNKIENKLKEKEVI